MAENSQPPIVDTKDVAVAGTPEALTTRDVRIQSIALLPKIGNAGIIYVLDFNDNSIKWPIPAGGVVIPINDPRRISLDVDTSGDGLDWLAV